MRDINRIDKFCQEFAKIWKEKYPDWRFGQLVINVFETMEQDPFFPEEDKMIEIFRNAFSKEDKNNKE